MPSTEIREPTFLILASLASGQQHGYGIMRDVDAISEGRVDLKAGTLYTALDRLLADGLVKETGTEVVDGRLRRYYKLTASGRDVLEGEVVRMRANANQAARRLKARRSEA
jgi:DNA-binding PadR family transcriptional regulator